MVTGDDGTKESPDPKESTTNIGYPTGKTPPKFRLMNRKERRRRDALNRKAAKNG